MKYEVKISDDEDFVWQIPHEDMTTQLASEIGLKAVNLARAENINKYLVDVRGIKNIDTSFDKYDFAYNEASEVGYRLSDRIAIVSDPDDTSHNFIETVSLNAGYQVKLFTKIQSAIDWLHE